LTADSEGPAPESYRRLDGERVLATITKLCRRIRERLPQSGLLGVGGELESLASRARTAAPELGKPLWPLRAVVGFTGLLLASAVIVFLASLREVRVESGLGALLQTIEAGINDVIFLGFAVVFLGRIEGRVKRRRALKSIHELRSLVHIVDMHQLTKDPEIALDDYTPTASSPERPMSRFELARYLDYCSEMVSLSGKVAALYVQYLDDPVVLSTVTEVETLATGISGKIWQKIVILDTVGRAADRE
jgi:hypothetical protein